MAADSVRIYAGSAVIFPLQQRQKFDREGDGLL